MKIVELSPICGVEVQEVDLRDDLSAFDWQEVRQAFLQSHLLVFHNQSIGIEDQARFLSHFGTLETDAASEPSVAYVSTERADNIAPVGRLPFHVDRCFRPRIPYAFSLFAEKMSLDAGPPTIFANAERAYCRLSLPLQEKLDSLSIVNVVDFEGFNGDDATRLRKFDFAERDDERYPHATHPAVLRLPETKVPVILVNEQQTSHFVGMEPDESEDLFAEVLEYLYAQDNVLWHDWQVGDFLVWNNLALHHGRPSAPVGTRQLRRIIVESAAIS